MLCPLSGPSLQLERGALSLHSEPMSCYPWVRALAALQYPIRVPCGSGFLQVGTSLIAVYDVSDAWCKLVDLTPGSQSVRMCFLSATSQEEQKQWSVADIWPLLLPPVDAQESLELEPRTTRVNLRKNSTRKLKHEALNYSNPSWTSPAIPT